MTGLDTLPESDPTNILRYRDGIYAVDFLTAAITEFQLFDYLAKSPCTLKQLCAHFGWEKRPADVLVTLIKANGLVQEDEHGVLTNTVNATEHLCSDSPWNLSEYYASLRDRPVVGDFVRVLKSGKPAHWSGLDEADGDWHGAILSEDFAKTFTAAMDCRGVFLGKKLADAISDLLNDASSLLDVGGGSGVYACALAANTPQLKARVLEQVPVDGIARDAIEKRGMSEQVSVVVGDMFKDLWPEDCDVHLFSNVMHDWDTDDILKLLERSREALPANGHVVIHETFLNVDKTGPLPVAEYSCILAHSTQGRCYSVAEMSDLLVESGFEFESFQETGGDRGVIVASASELDNEMLPNS